MFNPTLPKRISVLSELFTSIKTHNAVEYLLKTSGRIAALLVLLLLVSFSSAGPSSAAVNNAGIKHVPYTFAVIPFYSPEKIWTLYSPFINYLNKTTGDPWELKLYHNHNELIEDICNGKVSAALMGPVPLGRANNKCGVKPLLTALGDDGKPDYHSVVLTNNPSIKNLKELKGQKIGFFKGSTAAHIVPAKMLKDAGVGMPEIHPVYLESQDRIMSALLSGEIAAAGVKETLAARFSNERLQVVAISAPLPNFALCVTPSLPQSVRQNLISPLTRIKPLAGSKDAETMRTWDDEINSGFVVPGKDFLPSVMKLFEIFKEIQYEN